MVRRLRRALSFRRFATRRRIAYSLAAGAAAGAMASESDAMIVYSGTLSSTSVTQGGSLLFNFDVAGGFDLRLKNYASGGVNYQGAAPYAASGRLVTTKVGSINYLKALSAGFSISSATVNSTNTLGWMASGGFNPNAEWIGTPKTAYMGFSFATGVNTYYGWLRATVNNVAGTFVVNDWAYENTSGTAIAAGATAVPEASPLGLLAAGSLGLVALRGIRKSREANDDAGKAPTETI